MLGQRGRSKEGGTTINAEAASEDGGNRTRCTPSINCVRLHLKNVLNSNGWLAFNIVCTLYILYIDDFMTIAALPDATHGGAAFVLLVFKIIVFVIFLLELCARCFVQRREYLMSFFFWLDIITLVSFVPDIVQLFNYDLSYHIGGRITAVALSHAGRMARIAARAARLISTIRMEKILGPNAVDRMHGVARGDGRGSQGSEILRTTTNKVCAVVLLLFLVTAVCQEDSSYMPYAISALDALEEAYINVRPIHADSFNTILASYLSPYGPQPGASYGSEVQLLLLVCGDSELHREGPDLMDVRPIFIVTVNSTSGLSVANFDVRQNLILQSILNCVLLTVVIGLLCIGSYLMCNESKKLIVLSATLSQTMELLLAYAKGNDFDDRAPDLRVSAKIDVEADVDDDSNPLLSPPPAPSLADAVDSMRARAAIQMDYNQQMEARIRELSITFSKADVQLRQSRRHEQKCEDEIERITSIAADVDCPRGWDCATKDERGKKRCLFKHTQPPLIDLSSAIAAGSDELPTPSPPAEPTPVPATPERTSLLSLPAGTPTHESEGTLKLSLLDTSHGSAVGVGSPSEGRRPTPLSASHPGPGRPFSPSGRFASPLEYMDIALSPDCDKQTMLSFLFTFRGYFSPVELLEHVILRFCVDPPSIARTAQQDPQEWVAVYSPPEDLQARNHLVEFLRQWLSLAPSDFTPEMATLLSTATATLLPALNMKADARALFKELNDATSNRPREVQRNRLMPPAPELGPEYGSPDLSINSVSALELARQMTIVEWRLYHELRPCDFFAEARKRGISEERSPNLWQQNTRFEQASRRLQAAILNPETPELRAAVMGRLIETAQQLLSLRNFNGLWEVCAALNSSAVKRLEKTWTRLDTEHVRIWEQLKDVTSHKSNFSTYRHLLNERKRDPTVPHVALVLTELTYLEEAAFERQEGVISVDRCVKIADVIQNILHWRDIPYTLAKVPFVAALLGPSSTVCPLLTEDQLWDLSHTREPRAERTSSIAH